MTSHTKDLSGVIVRFDSIRGSVQASRVLSNLSQFCPQTASTDPVSLSNLWPVKSNPTHSLSNMCIENTTEAYDELRKLSAGSVVLDVTGSSQGRSIPSLQALAARAKANGVSLLFSHTITPVPHEAEKQDEYEQQLLKKLREEVLVGCPVTSEASTDSLKTVQVYTKASAVVCDFGLPLMPPKTAHTDAEASVLKVCGKLHSELHKDKDFGQNVPPIFISLPPFSTVHAQVLSTLRDSGADLSRVVFNQVSLRQCDVSYWIDILNIHPCSICVDSWGYSATFNTINTCAFASDSELIESVLVLIQAGFSNRIILSLAIYCKIQLGAYGGYGYAYLQNTVAPALYDRLTTNSIVTASTTTTPTVAITDAKPTTIGTTTETAAIIHALTGDNLWTLLNWRPAPPAVAISIEYLSCHICSKKFVPGNHFSKFGFDYCTTKCLGVHRTRDWK